MNSELLFLIMFIPIMVLFLAKPILMIRFSDKADKLLKENKISKEHYNELMDGIMLNVWRHKK